LNFNEYQEKAYSLAQYPNRGHNIIYPALGLAGEAGEAVDKIKKIWRNLEISDGKLYTTDQKEALIKELGDVLWYIGAIATELDTSLQSVAQINIDKLLDRTARGVVKSEGDNR